MATCSVWGMLPAARAAGDRGVSVLTNEGVIVLFNEQGVALRMNVHFNEYLVGVEIAKALRRRTRPSFQGMTSASR